MATAAQAIESVAEITGLLPATVFRAARFMREADPTLWPMGEKGRGRAAQVSNTHLVNLALVLAFDEAATASPNTAPMLRSMRPWLDSSWKWQATSTDGQIRPQPSPGDQAHPGDSAASRLTSPPGDKSAYIYEWTKSLIAAGKLPKRLEYAALPGETLGEALENLVDYLTLPEGDPLKTEIKATSMEVDITSAGLPSAFVGYWSFDGDREFYVRTNYLLPQESLNFFKLRFSLGITRTGRIHGDLILRLAELWAETKTRLSDPRGSSGSTIIPRLSTEVTPEASSETKTATTGPGRLDAAVLVDQSRMELGGLTHPHSNGEREKSQSLSSRAGRSLHHDRRDAYARSGDGGAYCATA